MKSVALLSAALASLVANVSWADAAPTTQPFADFHGGLCLVVGAKDTALAMRLAGMGEPYVQVLQPDAKLAVQWGAAFAAQDCRERENLGVRNAAFDPEHYGTDLLNLIIVEDAAALGKARLADLCRILVPNGVVVARTTPAGFAEEAKALDMSSQAIGAYAAAYRKPVKPFEWKPADSLKWRAGMRAHMACGICGPTHGAGRYFYREWVEAEGWSNNSTTQLVARDAFNGRVLWIKQEEAPWKTWRTSQWTGHNWTLGADDAGRLFAVTKDARLVCLDGATGEQRFELLAAGANPGYVQTHLSKYVLYAGTVFSAETGKQLWKPGGKYVTLHEETVLESDGRTLRARKLADGSELFKADLAWRGERVKMDLGIMHLGSHIIITEGDPYHRPNVVTALDPATGEKLWSQELGGIFALPFRGEKGKTFGGEVRYTRVGDKLLAYCHTQYYYVTGDDQKEVHFTSIDLATGKIDKEDYGPKGRVMGSACATEKAVVLGDYLLYHHNVWRNIKTMERVFPYLVHPSCSLPPATAYGMIYNSPGRKGHSIQGITAIGPADITFDQAPGGKIFQRYSARPALSEPTTQTDWPTFRANNARGNAAAADLGDKLEKVWEAKVGLGGRTYGQMYAERTGLTQATVAYGTAYVADIGAQRIVALDVKDGKQQWVYHAGSRVDFPPTLYKGLCLFASKDGFVHCLDAKTGAPGYKLLVAPRERFIGGQEKLESLWPTVADVMVDKNGVGHASAGFSSMIHGGNREVTFNVETGEVVQSKVNFEPFDEPGAPGPKSDANIFTEPLAGGFRLSSPPIEDMLGYGNSISRTNEDRANEVFGDLSRDMHGTRGRACGRVIAFDEKLCVAHFIPYGGESWDLASPMFLLASNTKPSTPLWKSDPIELVADDIVLTPKYAYCVGHYRRVKGNAEVWVVSREDGKVLSKTPVDGFPVFMGASAAGNRLFVATRDGQLICYRGYYP